MKQKEKNTEYIKEVVRKEFPTLTLSDQEIDHIEKNLRQWGAEDYYYQMKHILLTYL